MSRRRRLRQAAFTPVGLTAGLILLVIVVLAAIAPTVWGHDAAAVHVDAAFQGPSRAHWLGTDALGRDLAARLVVAARASVALSALATLIAVVIGVPFGAIPVLLGPRAQRLMVGAINLAVSFPSVLLALFTDVIVGVGPRGAVIGIAVASAPIFARLSQTLAASVAGSDYLAASRLLGLRRRRLLFRHVLPNIAEPLILNVTISIGGALLALSALSFLGLGVQPPGYDWGRLLSDGLSRIYEQPVDALGPAVAIVVTGIGFSLAGEVLARYAADDRRASRLRRAPRATASPSAVQPDAADYVLQVRDLRVSFALDGGTIEPVRGISFDVRAGEVVGIVGESGSGKSLTALAVADLLPHPGRTTADRLEFLGRPIQELPRKERAHLLGTSMALVYQNPTASMNPLLRVGTQLREVAQVHGQLSRKAATERAVDRLRAVRIPNPRRRFEQYPHEFSGGMRQRAMVAMGLMATPRLIIADEPTTAVDVTVQQQVLRLLRDVVTETKAGILFISHDLAVVAELCDRVLVMYAGRIVEELDVDTLRTGPAHPYTQALLAASPSMTTERDVELISIDGQPPPVGQLPAGCPFAPRCRYATEQSHVTEPTLIPVGERDGHRVACYTPLTRSSENVAVRS